MFRPALACRAAWLLLFPLTHPPPAETEKLKFTPPPRPQQCMEFDKEATVPCSATGREKPTIKWIRAGGYQVGMEWGQVGQSTGQMCACLRTSRGPSTLLGTVEKTRNVGPIYSLVRKKGARHQGGQVMTLGIMDND